MKVLLLSQYDESQATTRIRLISLQKKLRKFGFKPSLSYLVKWDYNHLPFLLKFLNLVYRYSHRFFILYFRKYDLIIFLAPHTHYVKNHLKIINSHLKKNGVIFDQKNILSKSIKSKYRTLGL